jgi:hypothetical protein
VWLIFLVLFAPQVAAFLVLLATADTEATLLALGPAVAMSLAARVLAARASPSSIRGRAAARIGALLAMAAMICAWLVLAWATVTALGVARDRSPGALVAIGPAAFLFAWSSVAALGAVGRPRFGSQRPPPLALDASSALGARLADLTGAREVRLRADASAAFTDGVLELGIALFAAVTERDVAALAAFAARLDAHRRRIGSVLRLAEAFDDLDVRLGLERELVYHPFAPLYWVIWLARAPLAPIVRRTRELARRTAAAEVAATGHDVAGALARARSAATALGDKLCALRHGRSGFGGRDEPPLANLYRATSLEPCRCGCGASHACALLGELAFSLEAPPAGHAYRSNGAPPLGATFSRELETYEVASTRELLAASYWR